MILTRVYPVGRFPSIRIRAGTPLRYDPFLYLNLLLAASTGLAALFVVVVGVPVFAQDVTGTNIGEVMQPDEYGIGGALAKDKYGDCYLTYEMGQYICDLYHQDKKTVATGGCLYRNCFEMIYTDEARVIAGDEPRLFPLEWNAWHNGTLTSTEGIFPVAWCQRTTKPKY